MNALAPEPPTVADITHRLDCHTRPPFFCECRNTFDANDGAMTVRVGGVGIVQASVVGQPDNESEYKATLIIENANDHRLKLELYLDYETAKKLADRIYEEVRP